MDVYTYYKSEDGVNSEPFMQIEAASHHDALHAISEKGLPLTCDMADGCRDTGYVCPACDVQWTGKNFDKE